MNIGISLLITIIQLLSSAMAWDLRSPLILVDDAPNFNKVFPFAVNWSDAYGCTVYDNKSLQNEAVTFVYCPSSGHRIAYCNVAEIFVKETYQYNAERRPRTTCPSEVQYIETQIADGGNPQCRHNRLIGTRYQFIYRLCQDQDLLDEVEPIQMYQVCYQDDLNQIILGSYKLANANLLENGLLAEERDYPFDFSVQPDHNNFLSTARSLYQNNSEYLPRSVVRPELTPFGHQRKPMYNYMNVAPMLRDLKPGWEGFLIHLRNRLSQMINGINVTAGILDTVTGDNGYDKYLGYVNGVWQIKIPYIFWILIYNEDNKQGVGIMMHNQKYHGNMSFYNTQSCGRNICNNANIANLLPSPNSDNFIYCCHPLFMIKKFNLDAWYRSSVLHIP